MADPTRLRILKALSERLAEIHPDDGYTHELSGRVFRGRDLFGDSDPVPMVSILEAVAAEEQLPPPKTSGVDSGPWTLLIQGFVEDDRFNPTDPAHYLMADVKRKLVEQRRRGRGLDMLGLGKLVTEIRIDRGLVRPPEEFVSDKAHFWLRVTLTVVENLADPYA